MIGIHLAPSETPQPSADGELRESTMPKKQQKRSNKKPKRSKGVGVPLAINRKWFIDKLADHKISQRQLAAKMELDPAAMNRTFKGSRKMQMHEARDIATIFGVPFEEVAIHAGVDPREAASKESRVPVVGWIDEDFTIHLDEGIRGARFVTSSCDGGPGIEALRFQTTDTAADALDGNILYYRPSTGVAANTAGRWCVVKRPDGKIQVRVLKPGYRRGTYNLITPLSGQTEEDVVLESAATVVRMEF